MQGFSVLGLNSESAHCLRLVTSYKKQNPRLAVLSNDDDDDDDDDKTRVEKFESETNE